MGETDNIHLFERTPMLVKILIGLAAAAAVFAIIVALQPAQFRIARSLTVLAPPAVVFPQVNALRSWEAWSPWATVDPQMKISFEGPPAGVGSAMVWSGNAQVGAGRSTVVESRPCELIRFRLDMTRPFAATSQAEFTFKPDGRATVVTWSMSGRRNFACKAIGLFMDCDKMCGDQFEKGLAKLKAVAESQVPTDRLTKTEVGGTR
jgi:hypothetical protein